ncbi:hypothetical protein C7974DRAFT_155781 [Boeremia exigua]|uniref:uncharacterized protein n=1 Tax=Boeremia exigua TaxID=749465 RepID=UPI001E8CFCEB|nr:uncharacterized protein C7974DRAFT_155781 [Boeremia exigua]KAH6638178.1 hypothetical protein C7974DRAFT_155781 [Boeremia exigua]
MASDLTTQSPPAGPRIPKLKYRNPLPPDQISLSSQVSSQESTRPPTQRQASAASSEFPPSPCRPSFETAASTTSSLASTPSSHSSSNDSKAPKKKKKSNSVFGFLSLKEPSQAAFEQFAEQQRKQGNGRGSISPSNSSVKSGATFASKKLPETVPKVNSKWDGVPETVKKRQSTAASATRSSKDTKRSSGSSFGTKGSNLAALPWNDSEFSVMSNESRGPPNSIRSVSHGINADIYHNGHYIPSSPSDSSLAEPSHYHPEEPMASGALPVAHSDDAEDKPLSRDQYPTVQDLESVRSISPASSTASVDTIVRAEADVIFKKMNDRPQQQNFWGGSAPAVQTPSEAGSESDVPESHDFLFELPSGTSSQKTDSPMASPSGSYSVPDIHHAEPPAPYTPSPVYDNPPVPHYSPSRPVQNFSRPMASPTPKPVSFFQPTAPPPVAPSSIRSRAKSSSLPTLYENSIASTESLETIRDDDAQSIAPSFTPSSIAPSELSEHWHQSSRDRLGLGGQMRKSDVLPWNTKEETPGKPKSRHRLSLLMKGALRS